MNRKVAAIGRVFELVEVTAYGLAAIFALAWLVRRLQGAADPPDEVERGGLWLLAGLAVLLAIGVGRKVFRQHGDASAAE